MDTLAFGYILPTTGRIRDFNPLETCAARRTQKKARQFNESELTDTYVCDIVHEYEIVNINTGEVSTDIIP